MSISLKKTGLLSLYLVSLVLLAVPAFAAEKRSIKLSHSHQADPKASEIHYAALVFAEYVNKNAPTLEVKIYPASALGSEREVYEAMQLGGGASCVISGTAILNNFDKQVGVVDLPFVWDNYAHAHKVLDGEVGNRLSANLEKRGFKVLGYMDSWGFRNVVTSKKEVKSPEDLKGLKIRTIETPIYIAAMNIMGVDPTPMSMGEVYTAMQTGVIDGYEHGTSVTVAQKFYEVSKFTALTGHLFGPLVFSYSLAEWNKLSPEEQKVVQAGVFLARDEQRKLSQIKDDEGRKELEAKGMVFHQIDTKAFQEKAIPVQDKLAADRGATELLKLMRAAR